MDIHNLCARGLVLAGLWAGLTAAAPLPAKPFYDPKLKLPGHEWLAQPDKLDMAHAYPDRAIKDHKNGYVVLKCRVEATGYVSGCTVAGEDPADYGFGEGALKLAPKFRFKPPADGGPAIGDVVNIPVTFGSWEFRKPAHANLRPGDAAILMTELKGARPPGRSIFRCPDPDAKSRYCLWSLVTWAQRPDQAATQAALQASDLKSGKSLLECSATDSGALTDCRVSADKSPKAEAALLDLAGRFRVDPKAKDGSPVTSGRILIEINWALLRAASTAGD